jgi:hypothetical protein
MRLICLWGVAAFLAGTLLSRAADSPQVDTDNYTAPAGAAPPVAPPLNPNSPLYHLAHDPKYPTPVVGYHEGHTTGAFWVAHRGIDDVGGMGWGWIRPSDGDWGDGKWIALQETPGLAVAPHRRLVSASADNNWEFRFWGHMAPYKAYDPHLDELLPVFVLQGYQVLGLANPLTNKMGPPNRIQHRPSGASSRPGRPILSDPGVD